MIEQMIIRYGEISLKGKNRSEFEQRLLNNLRRAVADMPSVRLHKAGGRILADVGGADLEVVERRLASVFGVVSLSPVEVCPLTLEDMALAAVSILNSEHEGRKATFKIEVKRTNKRFPLNSLEVAAEVGGRVLDALDNLTVDVHHPDSTIFVEVRDDGGYVYGTKLPAVGGLPVGSAGRVGLLLSGGIDSPVAGWLSLKRGVELEAIHFHSFPFTSQRALDKVETLAQILANWAGRVRLHTVYFTDVQTEIRKHCPESLGITIMRRMMVRIAEQIARERKLLSLVTGESLGQVASQTLESIRTINAVTNLPILRPLITEDKVDIMKRARQIGTYETSILPYEDCCTIFVPKSPRTRPRVEEAEEAEANLDVPTLVKEAVRRTTQKTFVAEEFVESVLPVV